MKLPTVSYKSLIEKYPDAKQDLEVLRDEKIFGLKAVVILVFLFSVSAGYVIGKVV